MKNIVKSAPLVALFALFAAGPVAAQTPAQKPAAPSAAPQSAEAKPAMKKVSRSRKNVDARHCLQFQTNPEVHRCALKYR